MAGRASDVWAAIQRKVSPRFHTVDTKLTVVHLLPQHDLIAAMGARWISEAPSCARTFRVPRRTAFFPGFGEAYMSSPAAASRLAAHILGLAPAVMRAEEATRALHVVVTTRLGVLNRLGSRRWQEADAFVSLATARAYRVCRWARSGAGSPARASTTCPLLDVSGQWTMDGLSLAEQVLPRVSSITTSHHLICS